MISALASLLLQPDSTPAELLPPTGQPSAITTGWTEKGELSVSWRTAVGSQGGVLEVIREGVPPAKVEAVKVQTTEEGAARWRALAKGREGRRLWWRVAAPAGKSPWGSTYVPSRTFQGTDFLIFGDAQAKISSMSGQLFAKAAQVGRFSEFSLHAGDLIDTNTSQKEWNEWLAAVKPLVRQGPIFATPGNHEYGKPGPFKGLSPLWNPLLTHPANGPEDAKNTSWHIAWSGIMVASLDCMADHKTGAAWLRSLPWKKAKWRILMTHFPVHVTMKGQEKPGWTKLLDPLTKVLGIHLVVTGHLHSYARSKDGALPMHVTLNSGGKHYRQDSFPWIGKGIVKEPLFMLAQARAESLTLNTYDSEGNQKDSVRIQASAHPNSRKKESPAAIRQ